VTPYYDDDGITIYHGDARDVLQLGVVADVIATDPPYSSGGMQEMQRAGGSIGTRSDETIAFDNLSTRGYRLLMREVLRLCNQADEIYLFTDWRMWIESFDAVEGAGWRVRNMLVWDKATMGMGMPWRNQHELIVFAKRGPAHQGGKSGNVLTVRRSGNKNHPTEKPLELMTAILSNAGPGAVLDPFMGSGTTLLAAKQLGRKAVGIELSEAYCEVAAKRLAQGALDFGGAA
jgi:DNA modification methylase